MLCLSPIKKRYFSPYLIYEPSHVHSRLDYQIIELPCLKCTLCLQKRIQEWSLRLKHQLAISKTGMFLTLTYSNDTVPIVNIDRESYSRLCMKYKYDYHMRRSINQYTTLVKADLQKFFKRLRYYISKSKDKRKIKYFACGEYGDKADRAHYHAIVFGLNPQSQLDKELVQKAWTFGQVHFGDASYGSARYVAKYCNKVHLDINYKLKYIKQGRQTDFKLSSTCLGKDFLLENIQNIMENCCIYDNKYAKSIPRTYYRWICKLFSNFKEKFRQFCEKKRRDKFYSLLEQYGSKLNLSKIMAQIKFSMKLNTVRRNHFLAELDVFDISSYPKLYDMYYKSLCEKVKLIKQKRINEINAKKTFTF